MRLLLPLLIGSTLAACSAVPPPSPQRAEAQLREALAGRVAGEPVSCLPQYRSGGMEAISDNAILFRDGSRIWLNRPQGGNCGELDGSHYTLVTRSFGSTGLCSGDLGRVVDLTSGIVAGSCVLGPFVPYTRT